KNNIVGLIKLYFQNLPAPLVKEGTMMLPARLNADTNPQAAAQNIPITARLLSDISKPVANQPFEALLYISKPVNRILNNNTRVYFFATYQADITRLVSVNVLPGNGIASGYFA